MTINLVACAILEKVNELNQGPDRKWNVEMIQMMFSKEHANVIQAIPLCESSVKDQWIWEGNAKGIFGLRQGLVMHFDQTLGRGNLDFTTCELLLQVLKYLEMKGRNLSFDIRLGDLGHTLEQSSPLHMKQSKVKIKMAPLICFRRNQDLSPARVLVTPFKDTRL
ncbi:hypothetical protein ACFE04_013322 [Oxalis oulophora]